MIKNILYHPCIKTLVELQHNRGKHQKAKPRKSQKLKKEPNQKRKKEDKIKVENKG